VIARLLSDPVVISALSGRDEVVHRPKRRTSWRLDFDDIGSKVAEEGCRRGAGEHLGEVEDADGGEYARLDFGSVLLR
jgi:hypothetical protein